MYSAGLRHISQSITSSLCVSPLPSSLSTLLPHLPPPLASPSTISSFYYSLLNLRPARDATVLLPCSITRLLSLSSSFLLVSLTRLLSLRHIHTYIHLQRKYAFPRIHVHRFPPAELATEIEYTTAKDRGIIQPTTTPISPLPLISSAYSF